jgi:hypothetical protein
MKMYELLSDESKLYRGDNGSGSLNSKGKPCSSCDKEAQCWCLYAAQAKCYYNTNEHWPTFDKLTRGIGTNIVKYTQNTPFNEIQKFLRKLDI